MTKVWEIDNLYEMAYQDYSKACRKSTDGPSQELGDYLIHLREIVDKYRVDYAHYADRCVTAGKMPLSRIAWAEVTEAEDNTMSDEEVQQSLSA